jgi:hypothetical protein
MSQLQRDLRVCAKRIQLLRPDRLQQQRSEMLHDRYDTALRSDCEYVLRQYLLSAWATMLQDLLYSVLRALELYLLWHDFVRSRPYVL